MTKIKNLLVMCIFFMFMPVFAEPSFDLWVGAKTGNYNKCVAAIKKDADVNYKGPDGTTPLWQAAKYGHVQIIQLLIDNDADVLAFSIRPDEKRASKRDSWKIGQRFLGKKRMSQSDRDEKKKKEKEAFKDDRKKPTISPFDIQLKESKDPFRSIPLHIAIWNDQKKAVKTLLALGDPQQIKALDEEGNTPVHVACLAKNQELFNAVVSPKYVKKLAYFEGHLLTAVNTMNALGLFPIHIAIENGVYQFSRVETLLSVGADVNALTADQRLIAPLELANYKLVNALKDHDGPAINIYSYLVIFLVIRGADFDEERLSFSLHPAAKLVGTMMASLRKAIEDQVLCDLEETIGFWRRKSGIKSPLDDVFRKMTLYNHYCDSRDFNLESDFESLPDEGGDNIDFPGIESNTEASDGEKEKSDPVDNDNNPHENKTTNGDCCSFANDIFG